MLWPILLILTPWRWLPWLLVVLIGLNVAAITGALAPLGIHAFHLGPLHMTMFTATFAPILLGSLAAVALHSRRGFALLAPVFSLRWMPVLSMAAVLVLLQTLPEDLRGWPNLVLHLVMTAALIAIVIREDNAMRPILTIRPIARIGQISYGVYIYHLIALHVVNMVGVGQGWVQFLLYSALSILIAEASFRTLETYFLHLRHKQVGSVSRAREPI